MLTFVLLAALLAMTALYVAAEFATVAARTFRIEVLAREGNKTARKLLPHLEDGASLDRYVAACQIGITVSSLLLGVIGQARLASMLRPWLGQIGLGEVAAESLSATAVLLVLTALQVVLGELVPKAVALRFPERVAMALLKPMLFSLWLYRWLIWALNGTGTWILRRMGVQAHGHRHVHSPEELEQIVSHGSSLDARQAERLRRVFRFGDRPLRTAMVPRLSVVALPVEASWDDLLQTVARHGYTRYPVFERDLDHILGLVHVKDLLGRDRSRPLALREHLREMLVLPASLKLSQGLQRLQSGGGQMALVPDEYGGTAGLVTAEDLIEEVVGEIHDEFDRSGSPREVLEQGRWLVRGEVPLADLHEQIGLPEDLPEVRTVGGLVLHHLGRRPAVGDEVSVDGLSFRVAEVRGARIVRVEICGEKSP